MQASLTNSVPKHMFAAVQSAVQSLEWKRLPVPQDASHSDHSVQGVPENKWFLYRCSFLWNCVWCEVYVMGF